MFNLWGPKGKTGPNGKKVIVRIYLDVDGEEAYIWRKSHKHALEISASHDVREFILSVLASNNIDLTRIATRRDLAKILKDKDFLTGDYWRYLPDNEDEDDFTNHEDVVAETTPTSNSGTSNIVNFSDYFNKKK